MVSAAIASYALYFGYTTVQIHRGLGTSAYDFGLYDQGVWLLSQGKVPCVTLMGRNLIAQGRRARHAIAVAIGIGRE